MGLSSIVSTSFERPVGAAADAKELEYITALHQTSHDDDEGFLDGSIEGRIIYFLSHEKKSFWAPPLLLNFVNLLDYFLLPCFLASLLPLVPNKSRGRHALPDVKIRNQNIH